MRDEVGRGQSTTADGPVPAWPPLPDHVELVEVGLRDGLQAVPEPIGAAAKVAIVEGLVAAGVRTIEAVSFAHPRVLPQLADAEDVMAAVPRVEGVRYRGLAPNLRGAQRAADCGLDELAVVVPADDEMARRNQGTDTAGLLAQLPDIARVTADAGADLCVAVATAFFAPARGPVTDHERREVVAAAADVGASSVYLASTTGMEHAAELVAGIADVRERHPQLRVGVHLHDRNGQALANALAAMQVGVDWLEAAFCGLGGDLWFPAEDPSVLGNAAMEDLVAFCGDLGVRTGIDLDRYREVVALAEEATGRPSVAHVVRGGSRADLAAASWPD